MAAGAAGSVSFGWDFDRGEFAVRTGPLPRVAGEILYQSGFWYRADELDGWCQRPSVDRDDQIRNAAGAIDQLVKARVPVANWHQPSQRNADLVEHYRWLQYGGPFPDADAAAAKARTLMSDALTAGCLGSPRDRAVAEEVVSGALVVEAMYIFEDRHWWLTATPKDDEHSYVWLNYEPGRGELYVTDYIATFAAAEARREFRVTMLRDTTRPAAARAEAARPSRRLRMTTAGSAPPLPPGPAPGRVASR
ncbi:hypothetical protein [Streptomyces sp. CBMA123]|uniref:hypothetical protein n=1 Tax=Streptomyces sp. CBMA123 TaxID=1896313 RepID=UPI001661A462|nr:hypothetical protein [Streptomyces sp. CBMA123]